MRIALVADTFLPATNSAAVMLADLATELAGKGNRVDVIVPSDHLAEMWRFDQLAHFNVLRLKAPPTKGASLVRRAASEIGLSSIMRYRIRLSPLQGSSWDGIVWYSPSLFLAPFVSYLKQGTSAATYMILRDICPDWYVQAGVMRRGLVFQLFKHFERLQYRVAHTVGVQSPGDLDYVRQLLASGTAVEVLYNWINLQGMPTPRLSGRKQAGTTGVIKIVFGGNIGRAQDMDNLLRLAEGLRDVRQAKMLLIGAGSEAMRVRRRIRELRLENVTLAGSVSQERFRELIGSCDIGLISLDRRLRSHNIPGKLLTYLAAGLPVVASVNPGNDLIELLNDSGAGIGLVNGDDQQFLAAVRRLVGDPPLRQQMAKSAWTLAATRFDVSTAAAQIVRALSRS